MNYIQSADGTLALRLEAHEAKLLCDLLADLGVETGLGLSPKEKAIVSAIRNAAATLNHE